MKHFTWTYVPGGGKTHKVGLLHGGKTGHLLIYCGAKIIIIDFRVRDSKVYSFFINDELCEIHLKRKGDRMFYEFHINRKADTPLNRARRKQERKYLKQTFLFFAAMALLVVAVWMGMSYWKSSRDKQYMEALFASQSVRTIGRVVFEENGEAPGINYLYIAENISHSSKTDFENQSEIILGHGMPLESGDEFEVEYIRSNPGMSKIFFDRPTEKQLEVYRQRVVDKHRKFHPELPLSIIECQVDVAFKLKGVAGLADLYFQDANVSENPNNNNRTFLRLTRDLPFQKKVDEECWD